MHSPAVQLLLLSHESRVTTHWHSQSSTILKLVSFLCLFRTRRPMTVLLDGCLASPTELPASSVAITSVPTISTSSIPNATSTPINMPTVVGPGASPPSLIFSAAGETNYRGITSTSTTNKSSYPAVLKGRGGASPPNPNLVPSGKVPPPVPPRGSISGRGRVDDHRTSSSRGEAFSLHANLQPSKPHAFNSQTSKQTSCIQTKTHTLAVHKTNDNAFHYNGSYTYFRNDRNNVTSLPICASNYSEADEFVSVEKVDQSYVIRTSPCPFKPARRKYASKPLQDVDHIHPTALASSISSRNKVDNFLNNDSILKSSKNHFNLFAKSARPSVQSISHFDTTKLPSLPQGVQAPYKMSRKDNKYSETYNERLRNERPDAHENHLKFVPPISRDKITSQGARRNRNCVTTKPINLDGNKELPVRSSGPRPSNSFDNSTAVKENDAEFAIHLKRSNIIGKKNFARAPLNSGSKETLKKSKTSSVALKMCKIQTTSRSSFRQNKANDTKMSRTVNLYLSDSEYRKQLDEQSVATSHPAMKNKSFLYGYNSGTEPRNPTIPSHSGQPRIICGT